MISIIIVRKDSQNLIIYVPRLNRLDLHTQLHINDQTNTQHIAQDKPLHVVGGCCVIGLCGATASLIINSSEDHTPLITLSLSEWQ